MFTAEERNRTAEHVAGLLKDDPKIEAVILVGSLVGGGDRWSDIDLDVMVSDDEDVNAVAGAWVTRMYAELPVVHHFETAFGSTVVSGFLLQNLLEVDVSFTRATEASFWEPNRLLHDRSGAGAAALGKPSTWTAVAPDYAGEAGFTWHDVLHAGIAIVRDRPWQAVWYMQRVRNRALLLASQRRGNYAEFFDYVDDLPPDERVPLEESLVGSLEAGVLMDAIDTATRGFLAELRRGAPDIAARLEPPLLDFISEVRRS